MTEQQVQALNQIFRIASDNGLRVIDPDADDMHLPPYPKEVLEQYEYLQIVPNDQD